MGIRNDSEKPKSKWFIFVLIAVALVINFLFVGRQEPAPVYAKVPPHPGPAPETFTPTKPVRHESEEQAAAARREKEAQQEYMNRYLTAGEYGRKEGLKQVAIAVRSETGGYNRNLTTVLSQRLKADSVQIIPSLFQPEFLSDQLFDRAWDGAGDVIVGLKLPTFLELLVLGRQDVTYTKNPSLENVITATMQLEVNVLNVRMPRDARTCTFTASGAGFQKGAARQMAEERIIKQVENDKRLSGVELLSALSN